MKVLNNEEAMSWCSERGFAVKARPHYSDDRIGKGISFLTAAKQSSVAAFVRTFVNDADFDEATVWLTDWPFYQPDEMAVVMRLRASIDETRWLIDAPAHVFERQERDDCVGLFNLCVQYGWDAFLFIPRSQLLLYNSHDDIQYVSSSSAEVVAGAARLLGLFDLTVRTSPPPA